MRTKARSKKMGVGTITDTREDYLRAIYLLGGDASVTTLAERLQLSKSTVSERLKDLATDGLVNAVPYQTISLTKRGSIIAETLTYKHRIIEVFLSEVLHIAVDEVHAEAEQLEHACSDKVIKHLADFLHHPTTDPHGTKISAPKQW